MRPGPPNGGGSQPTVGFESLPEGPGNARQDEQQGHGEPDGLAAELTAVLGGALGETVPQGAQQDGQGHGGHVLEGEKAHHRAGHGVGVAEHGAPAFAEVQNESEHQLEVQCNHGEEAAFAVSVGEGAPGGHAGKGLDDGEEQENEDHPSQGPVQVLNTRQHGAKIRGYIAPMQLELHGKHALVCGASQGIGLAAAQELAALGATCILLARNAERLEAAVASLPGEGHRFLVADFTDGDAVAAAAAEAASLAPITILVNNTGGPAGGPAHAADPAAFLAAFSQHLMCNQRIVQALLPGMRSAGEGRIVNVISTSVKQPLDGLGVSNTVRGAVANWAKTLANELGPDGITVNNVLPGATRTARLSQIAEAKSAKTGVSAAEVLSGMAQAVPLKRLGEAHEIGAAIAFLCSPAAAYISGINLPVDGGRTRCL